MRHWRHRRKQDEEAEINITPMLDIVFIMLIFFIVTTSFVRETGIEVNRPRAETAEKKDRGNILVAIRADGEVWIDKRPGAPTWSGCTQRTLKGGSWWSRTRRPEPACWCR